MPFGADTPTPEFVGNSRVRGARSPPGTPRDPTTPSRAHLGPAAGHTDLPGDFARAKRRSVPPAQTSSRQSGEVPPARTSPEQSRKVCPAAVPGGGSVCPPGRQKPPGEKKPGFFPAPTRMYKEARPPFSQKKPLTFRPGRVMDVRTRRETAHKAQPGRAGEAAAGRKEHTP